MYLSKLVLNPRHRQVQKEIAHPYQLHRTIMRAFPEELPKGERVLYRLEIAARGRDLLLLVQSHTRPDWEFLQEKSSYLLQDPQVKAFELQIKPGDVLRFRLQANPTVKTQSTKTGKKTRVPLVREEEQLSWLQRKGEQHGFRLLLGMDGLPIVRVRKIGEREDTIHREQRDERVTIYVVQFDGFLQVVDAEKFIQAVHNGIGPAKSFGCGLISLARV